MKRLVVVLLAAVLVSATQAAVVALGSDADTWVRDGSTNLYGGDPSMYHVAGVGRVGYIRFDLSAYAGETILDASLTFTKATAPWGRSDTLVPSRFAMVGLDDIDGNTAQDWDEATLGDATVGSEFLGSVADPIDLAKVTNLDADDGVNTTETMSANYTVITITGDDLVAFLQNRLDNGGLATVITAFPGSDLKGYWLASKEYDIESARPVLSLTIPEPGTMVLLGLGSLLAVRRKQQR